MAHPHFDLDGETGIAVHLPALLGISLAMLGVNFVLLGWRVRQKLMMRQLSSPPFDQSSKTMAIDEIPAG